MVLANQRVCSSLGRLFLLTTLLLNSAVLCVGMRPSRLSPTHLACLLIVSVQFVFRQSCWWDFMGVASYITRRQDHSKFLHPLALIFFLPPLSLFSLSLRYGSVLWMCPLELGSALRNYAFSSLTYFCIY